MVNTQRKKIYIYHRNGYKNDYPKHIYKLLNKIEDRLFWFCNRNKIIKAVIEKCIKNYKNMNFLEMGCGTGFVLSFLEKLGFKMTGIDLNLEGLKFARERSLSSNLICADIMKDKIKGHFDIIGSFDVIEHIENDDAFIAKSSKLLRSGGYFILTVPSDMKLWSEIDVISGHKRRYTKSEIISKFERLGFKIEMAKYFNFFLYFPELIFRRVLENKKYDREKNDIKKLEKSFEIPNVLNIFLNFIFSLESILFKYISFPFGASIVLVARKKS